MGSKNSIPLILANMREVLIQHSNILIVFSKLVGDGTVDKKTIHEPDLPTRKVLLERMSAGYLMCMNYSFAISKYVELPLCFVPAEFLRYKLLNPMAKATQGSIDGGCLALEHGWAINLSGGYHHATCQTGGGFCIYPDITLTIQNLRKWHPERINKVLIVDLVNSV